MIDVAPIRQNHIPAGAGVLVVAVRLDGDFFAEGEVRAGQVSRDGRLVVAYCHLVIAGQLLQGLLKSAAFSEIQRQLGKISSFFHRGCHEDRWASIWTIGMHCKLEGLV